MSMCPNCAANRIAAPHVYCTLQCKRSHATTAITLTSLIAAGQGSAVPNAAAQLTTINTSLASIAPASDGSEPW